MTTLTLPDEPVLLKKDARGRLLMPAGRREAILDEFERCGMSGAAFARQQGIKYQTFMAWCARRKRRANAVPQKRSALALAEVVVAANASPALGAKSGLRIDLPGGATMHVCRPEESVLAASLLHALAQRGVRC